MPARSKAQQRAAGTARAAKRSETARAKLKGAAREMLDTMTETELEDLAATPLDGLPDHVES